MRDTGVRLSSSRSLFYPIRREADNDGLRRTVEFSRRERAAATVSKSERSCARSGRLQRWVRRAGPSFRVAASLTHHPSTEPRGTTGVRRNHTNMQLCRHDERCLESPAAHDHPRHDERCLESRAAHDHAEHDGQSAPRAIIPHLHNGPSAPRAFVPHLHHTIPAPRACEPRLHDGHLHNGRSYHASIPGHRTTQIGITGVHESRPMDTKKGVPTTLPSRRTLCPSVAPPPIDRYWLRDDSTFQRATILRTRSGVNCMGLFGSSRWLWPLVRLVVMCGFILNFLCWHLNRWMLV